MSASPVHAAHARGSRSSTGRSATRTCVPTHGAARPARRRRPLAPGARARARARGPRRRVAPADRAPAGAGSTAASRSSPRWRSPRLSGAAGERRRHQPARARATSPCRGPGSRCCSRRCCSPAAGGSGSSRSGLVLAGFALRRGEDARRAASSAPTSRRRPRSSTAMPRHATTWSTARSRSSRRDRSPASTPRSSAATGSSARGAPQQRERNFRIGDGSSPTEEVIRRAAAARRTRSSSSTPRASGRRAGRLGSALRGAARRLPPRPDADLSGFIPLGGARLRGRAMTAPDAETLLNAARAARKPPRPGRTATRSAAPTSGC